MQTYINLATIIGGFGFNTALLKLASEKIDSGVRVQFLNMSLLVSLISIILLYAILFLLNEYSLISEDIKIQEYFPVYAIFMIPLTLQSVYMSYFQSIKKIKELAKLQVSVKIISVVIMVIFTYWVGIWGYILVVPLTGLIGLIIMDAKSRPVWKERIMFGIEKTHFKIMWKYSVYALAANIVGTLATTLDIYFVNYYVQDRIAVGYYMFALTVMSVFQILPTTIQQIAFPYFSEKSSLKEEWLKVYYKYNKMNHLLMLFAGIIGLVAIPLLIKIVFVNKYNEAIPFFILLSFGWIIRNMNIMKGTSLMGMGKFNLNLYSSLISIFFICPILFLIIKQYGINGAAYSQIVVGLIIYVTTGLIFKKSLRDMRIESRI